MRIFLIVLFGLMNFFCSGQGIAVNEKDKYTGSHTVESNRIKLKEDFFGKGISVYIRKVDSVFGLYFVLRHYSAFSITEGQTASLLLESEEVVHISAVTNTISSYLQYGNVWVGDAGYIVSKEDFQKLMPSPLKSIRLMLSDHSNVEFPKIPYRKSQDFQTGLKNVWGAVLKKK